LEELVAIKETVFGTFIAFAGQQSLQLPLRSGVADDDLGERQPGDPRRASLTPGS
jgi:hypothetical protein